MKKLVILLIIIMTVFGCKTPQGINRTEVRQSDTLIVKSKVVRAPRLSDVLTLKDICDTVTKRVMQFEKVFVIDNDTVKVLTDENNQLQISITKLERTRDSLYSEIRNTEREANTYQKEVIVRTNWKMVLWFSLFLFAVGFFKPWKWF